MYWFDWTNQSCCIFLMISRIRAYKMKKSYVYYIYTFNDIYL
jgi:hypothetical protein